MRKIVLFTSFSGRTLMDAFDRSMTVREGLDPIIVTDNTTSDILGWAAERKYPVFAATIKSKRRDDWFRSVYEFLHPYESYMVFMCGFKWIVPEEFVTVFNEVSKNHFYNIHPASLKFKGKDPHKRVYNHYQDRAPCSVKMNTIHEVTVKVDDGKELMHCYTKIEKAEPFSDFLERVYWDGKEVVYRFLLKLSKPEKKVNGKKRR